MRSVCRSCPSFGSGIVQGVHIMAIRWFVGCEIRRMPLQIYPGDFLYNW